MDLCSYCSIVKTQVNLLKLWQNLKGFKMWATFTNQTANFVQSKLFITSFVITEYLISDTKLLGTDLFPLKLTLYNRIFT